MSSPGGNRRSARRADRARRIRKLFDALSLPLVVWFVLDNERIDPAYNMTWWRRFRLGLRLYRNTRSVTTGASYRAHLLMAAKLLEIPPSVEGVVVECGVWRGGTAVNLSIICDIVDRTLILYDSFEGLPEAEPTDATARATSAGYFRGTLEQVQSSLEWYGAPERCILRKGWFRDSLPLHSEPVVFVFADVDFQASLHDCVVNLWPHLTEDGFFFLDDFLQLEMCALFYSERFWAEHFDAKPPGLLGAGSGVGLGQFWVGPRHERIGPSPISPLQAATTTSYTQKGFCGFWGYERADAGIALD